jgi:L-iditol 2-dehydrogenase
VATCDPLSYDLDAFARSHTQGRGTEATFFTAGGPPAVEEAVGTLAKGGHLVLYGSIHPKEPITIDPNKIHYDEISVTGLFSHTRHSFQQAVRLISSGVLDLQPFVSETVPFQRVEHAFARAADGDTYRVVVTFDEPTLD